MDKKTIKILMKKVKKFKTWTEQTFVNPICYRVNGRLYYMTGFIKKGEVIGTAYFTLEGEEAKAEAYEAQLQLSTFADISKNVFTAGEDRLKIDPTYFTTLLAYPLDTERPDILAGYQAYTALWERHQKFCQLFEEYKDYYEYEVLIREEITVADVRKTQKTASTLDVYQYFTLNILLDKKDEIRAYVSFLETTPLWQELTKNQRVFAKGITEEENRLKTNLQTTEIVEYENHEEMLQRHFEYVIELNAEKIKEQQRFVRYPK